MGFAKSRTCSGQRQLHATELLVERAGLQPRTRVHVEGGGDLGDHHDPAVLPDVRLVEVRGAVVRREVLGGDVLAQVHEGVERAAVVIGEPLARREPPHLQPFVQQEVKVPSRHDE
jgi:hypothetical protein